MKPKSFLRITHEKDASFDSIDAENQEKSDHFVSVAPTKNKFEFSSKLLDSDYDTGYIDLMNPIIHSVPPKQTNHKLQCSLKQKIQRHVIDNTVFEKNHPLKHSLNSLSRCCFQQKSKKIVHHSLPKVLDHLSPRVLDHSLLESFDHLSKPSLKGYTTNHKKIETESQVIKTLCYDKYGDRNHVLASFVKKKCWNHHHSNSNHQKDLKYPFTSKMTEPAQDKKLKGLIYPSSEKHGLNGRRCTLPYIHASEAIQRDPKPIACRLYQKRFTAVVMQDCYATVTRIKNRPDIDFVHRLKDIKSYAPYVHNILQLFPRKNSEKNSYHSVPSCKIN